MRLVVFGLAVSSSWGNGHAALWRALIAALLADGHRVVFFERDVDYYAQNRDLHALPEDGELVLYRDWAEALPRAGRALAEADGGRPVAGDRPWRSHADHRMATTGALLGLATPGLVVEDVASTGKTLPGFVDLWTRMLP